MHRDGDQQSRPPPLEPANTPTILLHSTRSLLHNPMMAIEEEPGTELLGHHHLLDWLEDSISFLPSFLNEPYCAPDATDRWYWDHGQTQDHQARPFDAAATTTPTGTVSSTASVSVPSVAEPEAPKKRKQPGGSPAVDKASQSLRRKTSPGCGDEGDGETEEDAEVRRNHPASAVAGRGKSSKKSQCRSGGGNQGNAGSKDVRWAEQLLNPCATAIQSRNPTRVQHLACVLRELASPSGDANHRLAAHGLRALTQHLSAWGMDEIPRGFGTSISAMNNRWGAPCTFVMTEPRLFRSALIRFQEVSPWFAFPNSLANASIAQVASVDLPVSSGRQPKKLHIVDIGVSHGIQWPTLLEALTRRPGRTPPLVRITTVAPGDDGPPAPFAAAPSGYDFSSHLLRYAKSINLNLEIRHVQSLDAGSLATTRADDRDETLVVCAQFRLHQLRHDGAEDELATSLAAIRGMAPDLVVLTEVEGDCCCALCCAAGGGFAAGFGKRVEFLWWFLDSTSAAFKGRDCGERRVVEGEAARALVEAAGTAVAAGGRERWRDRMVGMGFRGERLCEDALDGGRALLRKYDSNWEMRVVGENPEHPATAAAGAATAVCLCWKGKPVSFCSLWKV
ncbi:hypothetical protein Taro_034955 [Colocasia esculenta]|uniref:Nodulation signaling pathway 1-like protein n=1 Tax=Colocasia esculenta TaxID=4460 RepID=A0A843VSY2_COLES|nr:hypothetical protein [Colocasia esculenta]